MDQREYFSKLFRKYLDNNCSPAETDELLAYMRTNGFNELFDHHTDALKNTSHPADPALRSRLEQRLQNILSQPLPATTTEQNKATATEQDEATSIEQDDLTTPVRRLFPWSRIAAAAIILLFGTGIYYFTRPVKSENVTAGTQTTQTLSDATPGTNKPVLTLAGGQKIILDSTAATTLARLTDTKIATASAGKLAYENLTITPTDYAKAVLEYNTLDNPRGSSVTNLTLSDGTKVWLNAGSSITYPVSFSAGERNVDITGEAYFEVTHDAHSPFTVRKKNSDTRITVLGTHFNVNAYDDENENKITLLEGAVNVTTNAGTKRLAPNEQAVIQEGNIKLEKKVDLESVMAWKNGQFILKGTDLAMLLRQIARWYDVDVIYSNNIPSKKFGGSISRNVNLSTVMEALKENGINSSLTGKKLTVD